MALKPILMNRINTLKIKIILQNLYQMQISKYLIVAILLNLVFIQNNYSQELKTYNGSFSSVFNSQTTANYEYYEDANLERIYNGKFELTAKNESTYTTQCSVPYSKDKQLIKGQYLNNKRDGYWEFSRCTSDWRTDNTKCFGNYIDGKKNGNWIYKLNFDFDKNVHQSICNITFKNDTIVGKLDLMELGKEFNDHLDGIKGEFDENGFMTGVWDIGNRVDRNTETIVEFYKGFLVKYIIRNKQDGAFSENFIPNKELLIKKIDELYKNNIAITHLSNALNYKEYDNNSYTTTEFGYVEFSDIDIYKHLSKIIDVFSVDLIPFEKNNYTKKDFYYKKPKILFRRINADRGSKAYLPTVE